MSPVKTVNEELIQVADKLKENVSETEKEQKQNINHCIAELHLIDDICQCIPESDTLSVLDEVQNDLFNSVIFACQGFYRNAHICLRSSLELTFSFIYYYDHHYDYVLWKKDYIDTKWSDLMSPDTWNLNKKFYSIILNCDTEKLKFDKFIDRIKYLYHSSSQSVHGKYEYMQTKLSNDNTYDPKLFDSYYKQFEGITEVLKSIIYLRFKNEIDIDPDEIKELDKILKKYEVLL